MTARQLETLIRVSTAFAKSRLSPVVEEEDAVKAGELLQFALYHEVSNSDSPDETGPSSSGASSGGKPAATAQPPNKRQKSTPQPVAPKMSTAEREALFKTTMMAVFAESGEEEMEDEVLVQSINALVEGPYSITEARSMLTAMDMSVDNTFTYSEGTVTRV